MSEFQIVKFRAVDRPLTEKQMQFMDRQLRVCFPIYLDGFADVLEIGI